MQSSIRLDSAGRIRALCAPPDGVTERLRKTKSVLRMSSSSSSSDGQNSLLSNTAAIIAAVLANPTPFLRQSAKTLTSLDLSYTPLGNESLALLGGLSSLKALNLAGSITYMLKEGALRDVSLFSSLTALDISESQAVAYDDFFCLTSLVFLEDLNMSYMSTALNLEAVGMLTGLRRLDLTGNSSLTNSSAASISSLVALESLRLEGARHLFGHDNSIDDEGVGILSTLQNLTHLEMYHCHRLTDESLENVSLFYTKLRHLRLDHCGGITHAGVSYLAEKFVDLVFLR